MIRLDGLGERARTAPELACGVLSPACHATIGHDAAGGAGSRAVLEVRSHDVPFVLEDGQMVGRLVYEPLTATPDILYGVDVGSNYQSQGLKLSKHFK